MICLLAILLTVSGLTIQSVEPKETIRYTVIRNSTKWIDEVVQPKNADFETTIRNDIYVRGDKFSEKAKYLRMKNGRLETAVLHHRVSNWKTRWSWVISKSTPSPVPVMQREVVENPEWSALLIDPFVVSSNSVLLSQHRAGKIDLNQNKFDPAVFGSRNWRRSQTIVCSLVSG